MFSSEICEISKIIYFGEHVRTTATGFLRTETETLAWTGLFLNILHICTSTILISKIMFRQLELFLHNSRMKTGLNSAVNYMFKVNKRNVKTRCEICSELIIGVFIVNFEHTSHLVLVFLLLTLNRQIPTGNVTRGNFVHYTISRKDHITVKHAVLDIFFV